MADHQENASDQDWSAFEVQSKIFSDPSRLTLRELLDYFCGDIEVYASFMSIKKFSSRIPPELILDSARKILIQNNCRSVATLWSWAIGDDKAKASVAQIALAQPKLLAKVVDFPMEPQHREMLIRLYGATAVAQYLNPSPEEGRAWLEDSLGI